MIGAIDCLILNEARERRLLPLWDRRGHSSEWITRHSEVGQRDVHENGAGSWYVAFTSIDPAGFATDLRTVPHEGVVFAARAPA